MENESKPKAKMQHPDRVRLTSESLLRISTWLQDVEHRIHGAKITRSDLVNFLIQSRSLELSEKEIEKIQGQYFDEVRFATWALRQIKEAKAQGKNLSLSDIVQTAPSQTGKEKKNIKD